MLVYGGADGVVNSRGGVLLHPWHDVRIKIDRGLYGRVAEPLLRDLGVPSTGQKMRCVTLPQIVKTDSLRRRRKQGSG